MTVVEDALPEDLAALKALVLAQRQALAEKDQTLARKTAEIEHLQAQLNLLLAKRFGPSSEKVSADQLRLFNEAEQDAGEPEPPQLLSVPSHTRRAGGRRPLPEALPRIAVIHELAESERICPHDGTPLEVIGEETSEQLDIIPAQVRVIRHIRRKYACPCCEGHVVTAPLPAQPVPKSLASPGTLAWVATAKYADGLPLHRQEAILARAGIELPRATLAIWMIKLGEDLIVPLITLLRERLLAYDIVQMDETTVQVLNEPNRAASAKSYMWVTRGGPPEQAIVLYEYAPTRGAEVPLRLLEGFRGYLQTDGYEGYNAVASTGAVIGIGCFAHARRKFDEALKAYGKAATAKGGRAQQGLDFIRALYRVEQRARDLPPEERRALRLEQAQPILDHLRAWLDTALPEVPPATPTGKALGYLDSQWPRLVRYLEDGRLAIDNNACENAIRPFVIGRRNWLFSDTVRGAKASANLYSLIETAKANGLEPYRYLRHIFTELPKAATVEDVEALLPTRELAARLNDTS